MLCKKKCQIRTDLTLFYITFKYLDGILNISNFYFDNMVSQIYAAELCLNIANTSDTKVSFMDLHLSLANDNVSTKIYDKREEIDFEIVESLFFR